MSTQWRRGYKGGATPLKCNVSWNFFVRKLENAEIVLKIFRFCLENEQQELYLILKNSQFQTIFQINYETLYELYTSLLYTFVQVSIYFLEDCLKIGKKKHAFYHKMYEIYYFLSVFCCLTRSTIKFKFWRPFSRRPQGKRGRESDVYAVTVGEERGATPLKCNAS